MNPLFALIFLSSDVYYSVNGKEAQFRNKVAKTAPHLRNVFSECIKLIQLRFFNLSKKLSASVDEFTLFFTKRMIDLSYPRSDSSFQQVHPFKWYLPQFALRLRSLCEIRIEV